MLKNLLSVDDLSQLLVKSVIIIFPILSLTNVSHAQEKTDSARTDTPRVSNVNIQDTSRARITGKVTDNSGNPIGGVSITVSGTSRGTTSDLKGGYTITAAPGDTIVFSSVGYTDQQAVAGAKTVLNVSLAPSAGQALQQVVVVGYGTQKKVDITGSAVTVSGDAISKQPIISVDQGLQGKVAGLNVINSGVPGAPSTVQLRGVNSVSGSTAPIYVVDGLITSDISYLDPSQIEKVDVLKDASSLAIFGVNSGNGAIMITTKKGKTGRARVNYSGYVGVQTTNHLIKMADASQYAELTNEQARALGNPAPFADSMLGKGTNWYKEVLRTALIHSNDVTISGGSQYNSYNFGGGFINTEGTIKETDYNNLRLHLSDEYRFGKVVKIGANINLSRYVQKNPLLSNNLIKEAYSFDPTVVPFADGKFGVTNFGNLANPAADLHYNNQDKLTGQRLSGDIYGEVAFLKHFTFRTAYTLDYNTSTEKKFTPQYFVSANQNNASSTLENWDYTLSNWYWRNYATYDQTFGDHHVSATAGVEARETNNSKTYLKGIGVPGAGSSTQFFNLGDPSSFIIVDGALAQSIFSYFGRVNYAYKDKYLLNASIRKDYASVYPEKNRSITTPAIGVGWRISEEDFFKNLKDVVNSLKLRYSWGKLPNANLPNPYIPYTQIGTTVGQGGTQPVFGGTLNPGVSVLNVTNPDLTWEVTEESDPGLEASFLHNRLTIEADYYIRKTRNAVINVPIPSQSGTVNSEYINAATLRNRGFEFLANYNSRSNSPVKWNVSVNLATLNNEVTALNGGDSIPGGGLGNGFQATITKKGLPIGSYYGYQVVGVFQDQQQLSSIPHTPAARVGDFIYKDINKDGIIDNADRINMGSAIPKVTYGISAGASWKEWDISVDMQGVLGNKIYNGNRSVRLSGYNFDLDQFTNRWHGPGTSNTYPATLNGADSYAFPSTFFVESGSYFRVRNLQVGYNLPAAKKWGLSNFRIYASAQNLLTVFGYHGFNPEVTGVAANSLANGLTQTSDQLITPSSNGQALNSGVDLSTYPVHVTYNLGLNVGF